MAGRRGGKTVEEVAEVGETCIDNAGLCGWGAPNFPILRDAWRDLKAEFDPFIREVRESEWTLNFKSGGRLECWSLDSGIVARGRKYHKFILDEAGLIANLGQRFDAEIEPTLGDYGGTLVAGSTPNLVGPDLVKWFNLGQTPDSGWKSWRWSSLDNPAVADNMRRLIEDARRRGVPEWVIRQEYFAEPAESDRAFFRAATIAAHKAMHAKDPERFGLDIHPKHAPDRYTLIRERQRDKIKFEPDSMGQWRVWEYPDPRQTYCVGVDLAYGVGSSNTVFSVGSRSTRRKVAMYKWPGVTPDEAAMLCAVAGTWFCSPDGSPAAVCFERNGPGEVFAKRMRELAYPMLWYDRKDPTQVKYGASNQRVGWDNNPKSKELVLGSYRAAMEGGKFVNPCGDSLEACLSYMYDDQARITCPFDRTKSADDPARVKHGDEVIADALLNLCFDWSADLPGDEGVKYGENSYYHWLDMGELDADEKPKGYRWGR